MTQAFRSRVFSYIHFDEAQEYSFIDRRAAQLEIEVTGGSIHEARINGHIRVKDCAGPRIGDLPRGIREHDIVLRNRIRTGVSLDLDTPSFVAIHGVVPDLRPGGPITHSNPPGRATVYAVFIDNIVVNLYSADGLGHATHRTSEHYDGFHRRRGHRIIVINPVAANDQIADSPRVGVNPTAWIVGNLIPFNHPVSAVMIIYSVPSIDVDRYLMVNLAIENLDVIGSVNENAVIAEVLNFEVAENEVMVPVADLPARHVPAQCPVKNQIVENQPTTIAPRFNNAVAVSSLRVPYRGLFPWIPRDSDVIARRAAFIGTLEVNLLGIGSRTNIEFVTWFQACYPGLDRPFGCCNRLRGRADVAVVPRSRYIVCRSLSRDRSNKNEQDPKGQHTKVFVLSWCLRHEQSFNPSNIVRE